MSTEPTIKFYGTVHNGIKSHYKPQLYAQTLSALEGKEFEETLQERFADTTPDQQGFYRAGIIRHACMESEDFGGWTEKDIANHFEDMFLTYPVHKVLKQHGQEKIVEVTRRENTANLGKKKMSEFIENVLKYLAEEHDIHPLSPEEYKNAKYATQIINKK